MIIVRPSPRCRAVSVAIVLAAMVGVMAFPLAVQADMAAAQAAIKAGNFTAAGDALKPLSDTGDAQAQYQWAALALDGHAVGLPPDRAISLLIQSAAQGNGHAQARLGMAYAQGDHVTQDELAAYHWLSRASTSPDLAADERQNVTTLRDNLLEHIAPRQTAYAPDNPDATTTRGGTSKAIPAAEKASPAPVKSVSAMPLFADAPLPTGSDDAAATGDADGDGKAAKAVTTTSATAKTSTQTAAAATKAEPAASSQAITTANAAGKPQGRAYMVQLASLPSLAAAQQEAARLQKKYAVVLKDVDVGVRAVDLGSKGTMQRVLAGPFANVADAKARCARLGSQKQACRVVAVSN
jgi:cell division septation protein DedD